MRATIYSVEGKSLGDVELPEAFDSAPRADLVKRAVLSEESRMYQPKGSYVWAGLETSARYRGRKDDFGTVKNRGIPHKPHEVQPGGQLGKVKRIPDAVGGRRAHPPKVEKKIVEKMNKREYLKALSSALAFSANKDAVSKRCGFEPGESLPIVMDDKFEAMKKTSEVAKVLEALKVARLIDKAKKTGSKAPLVVASEGSSLLKAAANLAGVDAVSVKNLEVRNLAPGTHPGRLTIFTASALEELKARFKEVEA